ncbi:MAG: CarD family transcriptional regulator [Bacteriovoracaceae bacterium]
MQMNLATKIANWRQEAKSDIFSINGVTDEQWLLLFHFFIRSEIKANQQHQVFVFEKEEDAEKFYSLCKELRPSLYYPDLGQGAFSGVFCSERALTERLLTLNKIHNSNEGHYIATTLSALRLKTPPSDFFKHNAFKLKISDIIPPEDLAQRLVEMGYSSAPTVEEEGTFSKKGEIFDIFPLSGRPFRIHYFDEMIEEIYEICPDTLRTLRDKPKEEADIFPLAGSALTDENITTFRANLPRPPFNFKHQKLMRQELLEKLDNHSFFPNFPLFFPLLFKESSTLFTELKDASLFHFFNFEEAQKSFALMLEEYNEAYDLSQSDQDSQELLPSPKLLYSERDPEELDSLHINDVHFGASFEQDYQNSVAIGVEPIKTYISRNHIVSTKHNKQEFIQSLIKTILNEKREKNIWIVYKNDSALKQIKNVLEPFLKAPLPNIRFLHFDLTEGFIYKNENLFFVGESDFFIHKSQKTKKRANRNNDVFAEQLSSLIAGDYVIHKEHGVGRYAGIETIELGKQKGDFIVLEYADNDKVYVPVYKLDLVQKHSNSQSNVKLANLKSKKFDLEKARASKSVKKLAFDLLELQAKRELKKAFNSPPPTNYSEILNKSFLFKKLKIKSKPLKTSLRT